MKKHGFTLIELLITIAIIGILAGAATTASIGSVKKAARSEAYTALGNLRLLEESFFADRACYGLVGGVCSVAETVYNYTATNPPAAGTIEGFLPGFKPGGCRGAGCATPYGLNFTYQINLNRALPAGLVPVPFGGVTVAQTPCFVATATAVAGTRVAGDIFVIDCNNRTNY